MEGCEPSPGRSTRTWPFAWLLLTACGGLGCAVGSGLDLADGLGPGPTGDLRDSGPKGPTDGAVPDMNAKDASGILTDASDASTGTCAFAGQLVSFDLTTLAGTQATLAASAKAPGVTAGPLTRAGVTALSSSGSMNSSNWPTGAIDTGKHYVFSVNPPPGCKMTVTALAIDLKASNTGPTMAAVGTSVDNYAALKTVAVTTAGGSVNVSLTGINGVTSSVEIRVFAFNAGTTSGTLRLENMLSVTGSLGPI